MGVTSIQCTWRTKRRYSVGPAGTCGTLGQLQLVADQSFTFNPLLENGYPPLYATEGPYSANQIHRKLGVFGRICARIMIHYVEIIDQEGKVNPNNGGTRLGCYFYNDFTSRPHWGPDCWD